MRELSKPVSITGDDNAREMIRYWIANDDYHISLLLGTWQDMEQEGITELYAWANVLSDIAKHIANAMEHNRGLDYNETMKKLTEHFIDCARERTPGLTGEITPDSHQLNVK